MSRPLTPNRGSVFTTKNTVLVLKSTIVIFYLVIPSHHLANFEDKDV